jgi:hypothetical protein
MFIFHVFYYFHHFIHLSQVNVWYFFKIKLFKYCDIDVLVIMHIDICFLKLSYFNYNKLKPLKIIFQINKIMCLKHDFLYEPKH